MKTILFDIDGTLANLNGREKFLKQEKPDWKNFNAKEVKQDILNSLRTQGKDILFTIDDRQSVVDMWRANGITCLQCKKGIISFYFSVKYTISIIKTSMRV